MWSEREKQRIGERGEKMLIKSAENIENDSKKAGNKKWEERGVRLDLFIPRTKLCIIDYRYYA